MNEVVVVSAIDWQGLYVDGKGVAQDEVLDMENLACRGLIPGVRVIQANQDWIDGEGGLPTHLADVKEET